MIVHLKRSSVNLRDDLAKPQSAAAETRSELDFLIKPMLKPRRKSISSCGRWSVSLKKQGILGISSAIRTDYGLKAA